MSFEKIWKGMATRVYQVSFEFFFGLAPLIIGLGKLMTKQIKHTALTSPPSVKLKNSSHFLIKEN